MVKNPPDKAGDLGSIPALGRSHMLQGDEARAPQPEPMSLQAVLLNQRGHLNEKPTHHN